MANDLLLPDGLAPSNLHFPDDVKLSYVDNDMFDICARVAEISPDLHIWLAHKSEKCVYIITESSADGVERLVFKVQQLDGRVLDKLREIMALPLDVRLKRLEAENYRFEEDEKERQLDELYENLGRPMWTQMEHDGFIQRSVSYPKLGVINSKRAR